MSSYFCLCEFKRLCFYVSIISFCFPITFTNITLKFEDVFFFKFCTIFLYKLFTSFNITPCCLIFINFSLYFLFSLLFSSFLSFFSQWMGKFLVLLLILMMCGFDLKTSGNIKSWRKKKKKKRKRNKRKKKKDDVLHNKVSHCDNNGSYKIPHTHTHTRAKRNITGT